MASPEKNPPSFLQQNTLDIDLRKLPTRQKLEIYKRTLEAIKKLLLKVTLHIVGKNTLNLLQEDLVIIIDDLEQLYKESKSDKKLEDLIEKITDARYTLDVAQSILDEKDKKANDSLMRIKIMEEFVKKLRECRKSLGDALGQFDEACKNLK